MASQQAEILEINKACKGCGEEKSLSEFWKDARSPSGYVSKCRSCTGKRRKLGTKKREFSLIKACKNCGESKPLAEFPKHKGCTIDGRLNQCSVCKNKYQSEYGFKNRKRRLVYQRLHSRKWVLRTKYGLSLEGYTELFHKQGGKCAICIQEIELMSHHTHVDHCHATGKVRGILCRHCNRGLGSFKDDETALRNAINYLLISRLV
jgi:hypothetical protein